MMKKGFLQFFSLLIGLVFSVGVYAQTASDLFFSEYAEGSSNHKYIELFNGTGASVDLSDYAILINYNGNAWNGLFTFAASTMLADKDVYVIGNSSADSVIVANSDVSVAYNDSGYIVGFNGDDVRGLCKIVGAGTTETDTYTYYGVDFYLQVIDLFGLYDGIDPGSGWDVAGVAAATKDHTLIRKRTVMGPNTDWTASAGTNTTDSEWIVEAKDTWTDVGMHTFGAPPPTTFPKYYIGQVTTNDSIFSPDSLGVKCWVEGIVIGPDFDGNAGLSFTIADGDGINVFNFVDVNDYVVKEGDKIAVLGAIDFYRGLTEIKVDSIVVLDSNKMFPPPMLVSMLGETTESELIMLEKVMLTDTSQWPLAGSSANVEITNGIDTFVMRIDSDTDIDGTPFPTMPFNVIGIGGQYDYNSPYDEGYQIFPRYLSDIMVIIPPPMYTIGQVTSVDADGSPDSLGVKCILQGVVHGVNYRAYKPGLQFVLHDGLNGIWLYLNSGDLGYTFREGDRIGVAGEIGFYNGLTEIIPEAIMVLDSAQTLNTPTVVTEVKEMYEAELVKFEMVWVADTNQWPKPTDYAVNVEVTNGIDTFIMRIVTDCDIHGTPVRLDTFHLVGLIGQYDFAAPYDEGYQIFPRYMTDLIHHDPVSVNDIDFTSKFRTFPNPNSGQFVLENNSRKEVQITVINPLGETVYSSKSSSMLHRINLNEKASGIYFIQVNEVDGDGAYTGRVLVK
ncbi:MAG: T9SS type A sorting domain-containing protein [Bacteroidetes bacterium]|jgi:DNA/RNA endonuclease YhcR with UshA esterase domain|nr:T9SS type A sorting domain-containing protein [Bacteroidota bacterium]MBT3801269.1 T9SS type A sorting domain-containing protein [Bacteroidota bacterium]MBT5529306.1 T9SS type A sorting domain-containing protein [Cytophagia bacterium]MBT6836373.1 T9SS type A sorting domain-containing protein [Bacteroidota bacterium]